MDLPRVPLKEALPRLYEEAKSFLEQEEPVLAQQLDDLVITNRCTCGESHCVTFHCDSTDPTRSPLSGRRPIAFDLETSGGYVMYWVSDGLLTSLEAIADYPDDYIHHQLERHGFKRACQ
jgi:hypothetical protein